MAGYAGNNAWLAHGKQTTAGTPAATLRAKQPLTGGTVAPERVVERLQETDASRLVGSAYLSRGGAAGTPSFYCRANPLPDLLEGVLGTATYDAVGTGSPLVYTHVFTPGTTLPRFTFVRMIGNALFEIFPDSFINSLTIRGEAGQPLTVEANIVGLSSTISVAEPASTTALVIESGVPLFFHEGTISLSGVTGTPMSKIRSVEFTVENNFTQQQTDDVALLDAVPGTQNFSVGFELIFDSLTEYQAFHYGAGTTQRGDLYTTTATFQFDKTAPVRQLKLDFTNLAYEEFPVEPDAGGAPIVVAVRGALNRPASGSSVTATVKNGKGASLYAAS